MIWMLLLAFVVMTIQAWILSSWMKTINKWQARQDEAILNLYDALIQVRRTTASKQASDG